LCVCVDSVLDHARFFDPEKYNIILVDQRGCAKSTPYAEIKENTTQEIVYDFEKLRKELKIEKWQLFGGSWGSLVAVYYAVSLLDFISCHISYSCTTDSISSPSLRNDPPWSVSRK
jgi:proline iminopeptidase